MKNMAAIILAAGKGTRMKSDLPKVLHSVNGRPMLGTICSAAADVAEQGICIVVGYGAEQVRQTMGDGYLYAVQEQQLGTGHAVQQALPAFAHVPEHILVLAGDTPLLRAETLAALCDYYLTSKAACTVLTAVLDDAGSYGRIIRGRDNSVEAIVEARDATPDQLAIGEFNSGVYCFNGPWLVRVIGNLRNDNAQHEYYLTDALAAIRAQGGLINAIVCPDSGEVAGVNDRVQLAAAAKELRLRKLRELMLSGVTIIDPDCTYIDDKVQIGRDTVIEPQVYLSGTTVIGSNCHIGPAVKITDATVGDACEVGPFALLRPGTILGKQAKAGHFVEIKKSVIGNGSKIPHLSYVGDCEMGERVNIGCGTITCNYDGMHKHKTLIGNDVFVGSNTNFVAPVQVGDGATIGAGSTITQDVPAGGLGLGRSRQSNLAGWAETRDPRRGKKDQ